MLRFLRSPLGIFGVAVVAVSGVALLLVPGVVVSLFSPGVFMPHSHCYLNDGRMVWLQGASDFFIGASYMMISGALAYLVYKSRHDIPYEWMFLGFGIFIFSCGWTHFLEVWTLWYPTYWLSGGVKAITAVASLATAIGFFYILPHVFRLIQTAKASESRRHQLAQANKDLERAYKDLETFSYSLSHDIRGPLRAVMSLNAIVLEEYRHKLETDGAEMMERAVLAGKRMEQLVQDVLALSRLSRSPVVTTNINLEGVLKRILQGRLDLQSCVHVHTPLLPVRGDEPSLSQCLENLLGNAAKFVPAGTTPEVHIRTESCDGKVRLWVEDNGIGIPEDQQQKIFEPFQRLHNRNDYDGSGLGLAIVRKAVDRMGGRVGVESKPGQGSRFWLELEPAEV